MKKPSPTSTPPKINYTGHITLGKFGVGSDGEKFVRVSISINSTTTSGLVRYDDLVGHGIVASRLNNLGAHIVAPAAAAEFVNRLQAHSPSGKPFYVGTRLGHDRDAFVLPDIVIKGETASTFPTCFDAGFSEYHAWAQTKGTRTAAKKLFRMARGNSRMILALGIAFVGPLRIFSDVQPVMFQLSGVGGTGKSSVGFFASSVWGMRDGEQGGGDSWINTSNNFERVFAGRNHTFLFLDETHLASPSDVIHAAFLNSGGIGKGRYNEISRSTWFVPVLSTSNDTVNEILDKTAESNDRAAHDRLIDVTLPKSGHGAFEDLHGHDSVGAFCAELKRLARENHGKIGRKYVECILREIAEDHDLNAWIDARRAQFRKAARKAGFVDHNHARVIGHFATVYAALRLAESYDLIPISRVELRRALLACLQDHLALTAVGRSQVPQISSNDRVAQYVHANRANLIDLRKEEKPSMHSHKSCVGYLCEHRGLLCVGLPDSVFENIFGNASDSKKAKEEYARKGTIRTTGANATKRYAVKIDVFGKREYVVAIAASEFGLGSV